MQQTKTKPKPNVGLASNISNAPERGTSKPAELRQIEYGKLVASKTNPRKDFNEEGLKELRSSIHEHGIKQPLIVRPLGVGKFEIVGGERRYRAAGLEKLATVPCLVEVMDDKTALEVQAIENLQREDLNPIEEAMGYKQLQDAGYSIEDLIKKTGKSRSRVFERLRLLKLSAEIQKNVLEGKLDLSRASLIGQVADAKSQAELMKYAVEYHWSHRNIKEKIEKDYQKSLQGAMFDPKTEYDPALTKGAHGVCTIWKSGLIAACEVCSQRSGNMPLFEGSSNVCTNLKCFAIKSKIGMALKIQEVEGKGQKVVRGDWKGSHVELDSQCYDLGWDNKESRYRTWAEALKKAKYTALLAVKEDSLVKVLPRDEARKLAKIKDSNSGVMRRSPAEIAKEKEEIEIRTEAEKRYIAKLGPAIIKGVGTEKGLLEGIKLLLELVDESCSLEWDEVAKVWSLPKREKATLAELIAGAIGMNGMDYDGELAYSWPEEGVFGLKLETFKKEVKAEREKAAEAAKKNPATKGGKAVKK